MYVKLLLYILCITLGLRQQIVFVLYYNLLSLNLQGGQQSEANLHF